MSHAVPDDIFAEEEAKKVDIKPAPPGQLKGQHKGQHPYRVVLNEVRRKLTNTKIRMEALLAKTTPDDSLDWCAPCRSSSVYELHRAAYQQVLDSYLNSPHLKEQRTDRC